MNKTVEDSGEDQFANGQSSRDLRVDSNSTEPQIQLDVGDPPERTDSSDGMKALRKDANDDLDRRIELPGRTDGAHRTSGGRPWSRRITKRVLLVALLILVLAAVAPFVWRYLQSYEATDDAQIDGHLDPLSSRIDGTVVTVHPEDDDRVKVVVLPVPA